MSKGREQVLPATVDVVTVARQRRESSPRERFEQRPIAEAIAERHATAAAHGLVEPSVELMDVILERRRRHEIRERRAAIGIGEERRDGTADRMLERQRDDVTWKRDGRSRKDGAREEALRKVSFAFRAGRHVGDARDALAQAHSLIVDEEERPILHHRSAEGAAELMPVVFRCLLIFRREVVARIECATAVELVGGAGEPITARPGEDVHLAAAVASEGGVIGRGAHLELPDRIDRRTHPHRSKFRVHVVDAVEQIVGEILSGAVHRECEVPSHRARRSLRRGCRSRRQQRQFQKVPAVERQLRHQAVVETRGQRRRVALDRQENRAHVDGRGRGLEGERKVEPQILIDREFDARRERAVLAAFDLDAVRPRLELRRDVPSLAIRSHATYFRRGFIDEPQLDLAGGCARRIEHDAPHRRALRLRVGMGDEEQQEHQNNGETYAHMTHKDIG